MLAEDFTQAIEGEDQFKHFEGIDLRSYKCKRILIGYHPPCYGLDEKPLELLKIYRIVYIFYKANTLFHNLNILNKTYKFID
ncbi:MAG: hypothetical protein ACTS73_06700 [Arsenophonus sp. NEOnobi-MAG3]